MRAKEAGELRGKAAWGCKPTRLPSLELAACSSEAGGCSTSLKWFMKTPLRDTQAKEATAPSCVSWRPRGRIRARRGGGCTAHGSGSRAGRAREPSRRVSCRAPCPRPPRPSASPAPGWLPPLSRCPPASGRATPQSAGGAEAGPGAAPAGGGRGGEPGGPSTPESCMLDPGPQDGGPGTPSRL